MPRELPAAMPSAPSPTAKLARPASVEWAGADASPWTAWIDQVNRPEPRPQGWSRVGRAASRAGHVVVEAVLVLGIGAAMAAGALFLR